MSNILMTAFDEAPFSKIKTEDYQPAIEAAIEKAREEIDFIANQSDAPTFKNTIEALDYAGYQLERVTSIFFNINSAETNDEIQKIAQEVSPKLSEFSNDITLNKTLFQRVKTVFDNRKNLDLNPEQKTLLNKKYKGFSRNGANLPEDKKTRLREIDAELAKLKLTFGENVLAETNKYELHLTNEKDLAGLPDHAKEAAAQTAMEKGKDGFVITLEYPSYIPFMKYAENRKLRKELSIAFGAKGFHNDELDNQKNVLKIASLRQERAQLLGYNTHAHFVLEERMAKSPENVEHFLEDMLKKAKPAAEREFKQLEDFAQELDNIDHLEKWDSAFYSEKLKQKLFDLDDEKLKPYFELKNVINGVFAIAEKLYGLHFKEVNDIDKYHKDVKTYRVYDENETFVAVFYADFHPRAGKRGGAWMTVYKAQMTKEGQNERPHISIVCNFTKPVLSEAEGSTSKMPSLLTFNEVTTLFHEFGHALHGMLADTVYPSLSSPSVYWDFVELPSQILENWCYEPEALALFATHYKTGEKIPMELIERIKKAANFQEGMQTLRQLSFGQLDMAWHGADPTGVSDVQAHEDAAFENTNLYPNVSENCMSTSFSHIFQGGYSSGYYSYKWAEVLDADAFAYFKESGIFNREVADKFKDHVLSQGGTEDPMVLYKRFRGSEPNPEALLKRAGLLDK